MCFAIMGGIIKHLSTSMPNEGIVFFRNALAFFVIVPLIYFQNGIVGFKTQQLRFHAIRGSIGVCAMFCFFYILGKMNFTEAILLKLTTPFFIPIVAWLWLKEKSSTHTIFAICVGFIGVIFILDPNNKGLTNLDFVLVGLAGAAMAAVAKVTIRRMGVSEPSNRIVFYFSVFASLYSLPLALNNWHQPNTEQFLWLFVLALVATIGQLLVTTAYRYAPAGKVGQFTYTSLVFSSTMGWFIWGEVITLSVLLGCGFIVSAGLFNARTH